MRGRRRGLLAVAAAACVGLVLHTVVVPWTFCKLRGSSLRLLGFQGSSAQSSHARLPLPQAALPPGSSTGFGWRAAASVSKVGPPIPRDFQPTTLAERWHWGEGISRPVCFESAPFTAVAMHRETLCYATSDGLVRTVDLDTGDVVGDYYESSHVPHAAGTALLFDSEVVAVGDARGGLRVWRARLPGSWGFAHSPGWQLSAADGGPANQAAVTGIAAVGSRKRRLVSSDAEGVVVFWSVLAGEEEVRPQATADLGVPVNCLCAAEEWRLEEEEEPEAEEREGVYAGTASGALIFLQYPGASELEVTELFKVDDGITAMARDEITGSLVLGTASGRLLLWSSSDGPVEFPAFHGAAEVRSLSLVHVPLGDEDATEETTLLVSAGADGRVGLWDLESRTPRWGLDGLNGHGIVVAADSGRLVSSGFTLDADPMSWAHPQGTARLPSWKQDAGTEERQAVQALLCMDMRHTAKREVEEPYWPPEEQVQEAEPQLA